MIATINLKCKSANPERILTTAIIEQVSLVVFQVYSYLPVLSALN